MKTLEDSRFKRDKKNWSVFDRNIQSYFGSKKSYLVFLEKREKIPLKAVDCSEDNMKVNLIKWALRYLKGNVNGESHSQQSQKGLSSWERKAFC